MQLLTYGDWSAIFQMEYVDEAAAKAKFYTEPEECYTEDDILMICSTNALDAVLGENSQIDLLNDNLSSKLDPSMKLISFTITLEPHAIEEYDSNDEDDN